MKRDEKMKRNQIQWGKMILNLNSLSFDSFIFINRGFNSSERVIIFMIKIIRFQMNKNFFSH
jgi:hypothetical protein